MIAFTIYKFLLIIDIFRDNKIEIRALHMQTQRYRLKKKVFNFFKQNRKQNKIKRKVIRQMEKFNKKAILKHYFDQFKNATKRPAVSN